MTNEQRRARAQRVIDLYRETAEKNDNPDDDSLLCDVLTDLRHWAEGEEINFETCMTVAEGNYEEET